MPIVQAGDHVEKRLTPREAREQEAVARLRSEGALLERLSGLGITPRFVARGEDGLGPWHRIERVEAPTLAARFAAAGGPLAPDFVERAARAAFSALAMLHEAADEHGPLYVVHADLSPTNVAIDEAASRVVILDLDLSWWRDGALREDGAFRGTIDYVAPELARGERPTTRSDLFSLAATLLHGVLGVPPRSGRSDREPSFPALLALAAEAPLLSEADRALATRGPGHAALLGCLELDPNARPSSARAVVEAIAASRVC